MRRISYAYALAEIRENLEDGKRMLDKIQMDPRRKLDQPNEQLHYWDGKVTGLRQALDTLGMANRFPKGEP
jgi:hypothetical protein